MQLRSKWGALAVVILMLGSLGGTTGLVLASSGSSAPAARTNASSSLSAAGLQVTPLNPAYVQYQQEAAARKVQTQTPDGRGLGYVPPPDELSKNVTAPSVRPEQTFPATYNLVNMGKVSPVKDQGSGGDCWAFATFGSLESYLLPGLNTTYSENNLKNLNDFDPSGNYSCNAGGNSVMSTAYLARWGTNMTDYTSAPIAAGPVTSKFDPYNAGSCGGSPTTSQTAMDLQNVYFLPTKQNATDNNAIKSALMTYGGVYTAFYWEGYSNVNTTYWNNSTAAYYDGNIVGSDHAVTIVGWDDNYTASNFSTHPAGNGAWICKNSWGTSFGDNGYFYVSYYDQNMGYVENSVFTAVPATTYTTNYQYDPFGSVGTIGFGSSTGYGANVFTANSTGTLTAVSFWAPLADTQYTAQVYVNPTAGDPTSGTLMSTISGTASYAGYYTENLTTTVPLTNGEPFAVVVQFTTPTGNPIPFQARVSSYDDNAPNAAAGQSFISPDGTTWYDLYDGGPSYVANIHAFELSALSPTLTATASPKTVLLNENFTTSGMLSASTGGLGNANVTLQRSTNNVTFTNVTTNVTNAAGGYQFSKNESAAGTYYYETTYAGNATYGNATSNTVSVNVTTTTLTPTLSPAVTAQNANSLDLFVRGSDAALWYKYWTGTTWTAATSLGGVLASAPAVTSSGSGAMSVFVQGTDTALWWQSTTNNGTTWSGWQYLGGVLASAPAVTSSGSGAMSVFVKGTDSALWWQNTTNNGATWSGWKSLGGVLASAPAVTSSSNGAMTVFVQGSDSGLWWQNTTNSGTTWSGWKSLGGVLASSAGATSPANGVTDVFVLGSDNNLWWRSTANSGTTWSGWTYADGI